MPIADLTPNAANPRKITDKRKAQLRKSLEQFGNLSPITWNKTTGRIIGGNQRLEGYRDLGHTEVDVWVVELDEVKEKAAVVALNAHAGEWDDGKLSELLASINTVGADMELTGFDAGEIDRLLDSIGPKKDKPCPKPASTELLEKWKVEQGQLWEIGTHRLLCGDALDSEAWKRIGGPCNLCFADPPYELNLSVTSLRSATKRDLLMMHTDKTLASQNTAGFRSFFCYTYDSADYFMWTNQPMRKHQLIGWWNWSSKDRSFKGCPSWINHEGQNQDAVNEHEQAKPTCLSAFFIRWFSKRGETVSDAFSGSGAMMVAANEMERACRSVELNPSSCAGILERMSELGLKPKRI